MEIRFSITKQVACSRGNVVANYLDVEHLDMHSGLGDCELISETDRVACFTLTSKIGPFRFRNVHYYEFRPPDQILNVVRSPIGPMRVLSTVRELNSGTPDVRCEVDVLTTIEAPSLMRPLRGLLEALLRRVNRKVLEEDRQILERRQRLFGDTVEDYLRDQQFLLFKETFRAHYSRRGP